MKIVVGTPPNWEELKKAFPVDLAKEFVICYDGVLYNPNDVVVSDHVLAHEAVHARQQKGIDPAEWTRRYIDDRFFRVQVEVEAYAVQLQFLRRKYGHRKTVPYLDAFALALSGPLYGRPVGYEIAKSLIFNKSMKPHDTKVA